MFCFVHPALASDSWILMDKARKEVLELKSELYTITQFVMFTQENNDDHS